MSTGNLSYNHQYRMQPLGLTQQQWFGLVGMLDLIYKNPRVPTGNVLRPIRRRIRAAAGRYTNANRNALIALAKR